MIKILSIKEIKEGSIVTRVCPANGYSGDSSCIGMKMELIKLTKTEIEQILVKEIGIILGGVVVEDDKPLHELGLDSMGFVELLVFIEKKFKLKLVESGLARDNFRTVRVLARSIADKLS